ncbi:MAG: hypothetical protein Q9160_005403 [Pyrenula sp. 1 TL-2023]
MTGPSGNAIPVSNLVADTSTQVKDLYRNIERNAADSSDLPDFTDKHGRHYSSPDYLRTLLSKLQSIETDGLADLRHLKVSSLSQLFDDIELEIADGLTEHVLKVVSIAQAFEDWAYTCFEPTLRGVPNFFSSITKSASDLKQSLNQTYNDLSLHPRRVPSRFPSSFPPICPGAIELINGHDNGTVASVSDFDRSSRGAISARSRNNLQSVDGYYKWWYCQSCKYRCEFHVRDRTATSLSDANLIVPSARIPNMHFRETIWAKFHLQTANVEDTYQNGPKTLGCVFCVADDKASSGDTMFRKRGDLLKHIRNYHFYRMPPKMVRDKLGVSVCQKVSGTSTAKFDLYFEKDER